MDEIRKKSDRREEEIDNIDEYMSGIEPGYTVVINRVEPEWAKGCLEELSVSETKKPIDLKYLISTWGGYKLRLRFRDPQGRWVKHKDLELYSFPPLLYGQRIHQAEKNPHLEEQNPPSQQMQPMMQQYYPPRDDKQDILEMMALIQKMRSDDLQALGSLIKQQTPPPPPPPPPPIDPFKMLTGAFGLFTQFQQMKAPQTESDNDEILGFLGKAVDVFAANNRPQQETRITPPTYTSVDLSDSLSSQDPESAVRILQTAVGKMDPDKQAKTMAALLGSIENIGGTELLLDQLEKRGILDPNENDDENADDDDDPNSRGEYGSDAGNDSNRGSRD
jgi:hypothetical protein